MTWNRSWRKIDRDPVIHRAIEKYRGLRLIRQDPWECLLSFLCSSAKRVDHIRRIIESLCRRSGRKIVSGNMISYGFPEPLCIQNPLELDDIGAGFRALYLVRVNQCIGREDLLRLKELSYAEARERLMELLGCWKENRRLHAPLLFGFLGGLSDRYVDEERDPKGLFRRQKDRRKVNGGICGRSFRPLCRLCAALSLSFLAAKPSPDRNAMIGKNVAVHLL